MLKNKFTKKAFTLIELLVVITIIWILATGGIAVFTKQLQWARDATRITDLKLFETAASLYFSDNDEYPLDSAFSWVVAPYMSKTLKDPKSGKKLCWSSATSHDQACWWYYNSFPDTYGQVRWAFKMWIFFEKIENLTKKASGTWSDTDGWSIHNMFEMYGWAGASTWALTIALDWAVTWGNWTKIY